jgi:Peptidase family S41
MRSFFHILGLSIFISLRVQAQAGIDRMLPVAALQEDFAYLRKMVETTHPGLYMHHSRQAMQFKMDSLSQQLTGPLSFYEFYKKIAYLVAEIRCEHTYCNYGSKFDSLARTWKLIPFQFYFSQGKAYVAVNRTKDKSIVLGDELMAINGQPIDSVLNELYKYIPSDGYMLPSKDQQLSSMAFNLWYYEFIGRPDTFAITTRNAKGDLVTKNFWKDLTIVQSNANAIKNPVNQHIIAISTRNQERNKHPWRLEFLEEKNAAVLTVQTFTGEKEKFFPMIDSFFSILEKRGTKSLIVDISSNGGGDEELAAELLGYFIDKPTRYISEEYLITDADSLLKLSNAPEDVLKDKYAFIDPLKDGKSLVKLSKYSQELKTVEPKPNRFKGKVYLYVNGITSSAASTFAAVMQSSKLAEVYGEETAGSFAGGGTVIGLDLTLPNSQITAHTSIVYQVFATQGRDKDRGVVPDHSFVPSFTDLINGNEGWRRFVMEKMK